MKYTVISGKFKIVVESITAQEAAEQAIILWKCKKEKPTLAKIITIIKPDNKEVYLSTQELINES